MVYTAALIGTIDLIVGESNVVPGSDSGWTRDTQAQRSRARGSIRDNVLVLSHGSLTRQFDLNTTPEIYESLRDMVGGFYTFVDWDGDSRSVYFESCQRQGASRPFRVIAQLSLVEQ